MEVMTQGFTNCLGLYTSKQHHINPAEVTVLFLLDPSPNYYKYFKPGTESTELQ